MKIANITKNRIADSLSDGKRFDGRKLTEYREIKVETGISKNAEGSARVKIGDTEVIAGVKLDASTPYTDSEDAGTLITTVELTPMSSSDFEPGPPKIEAVETARIVDRGIRESGFIDFKKLCIKEGEKVWGIFLDIYSVNANGNLIDACALAAVAALRDAKMPKYDEKTERVQYGEWTNKKVPLSELTPITMTFHKVGKNLFLDPTAEEEAASEGRLSVAISKKGSSFTINAAQKGAEAPFSQEEVLEALKMATESFKTLSDKLE
ncbi:MAG: exosome complex protein Rrp42 [archaeon]